MRPAFRTTYWQNYPQPFYPGSSGQYPVPGWGVRPVMAGPARLGVGNLGGMAKAVKTPKITVTAQTARQVVPIEDVAPSGKPPVPSYVWLMASAFALGGAYAFVQKRGWIGRKR